MPRLMLINSDNRQVQNSVPHNLHQLKEQNQVRTKMDKMKLDRLLRKKRSKEYMDALNKLDAGGHAMNRHKIDEIINTIRAEFPEVDLAGVLLGFVSTCYLGKPYEVHTLDMTGKIIQHYESGQPLPEGLERARSIAIHGGYAYIEVYVDSLRAISSDGLVAVIEG